MCFLIEISTCINLQTRNLNLLAVFHNMLTTTDSQESGCYNFITKRSTHLIYSHFCCTTWAFLTMSFLFQRRSTQFYPNGITACYGSDTSRYLRKITHSFSRYNGYKIISIQQELIIKGIRETLI